MLAKFAEMELGNLSCVLYSMFFEYALEDANERASIACGRLIPSFIHVLDKFFALGFELRDGNDEARFFFNWLIDGGGPRRRRRIERQYRPSFGFRGLDDFINGSCDLR